MNTRTPDLRAIAWDAMRRYGFEPDFPATIESETAGAPPIPDRLPDLRHLPWSSIDNHDSRDLDQIEYCEEGPEGAIRVAVAIADVDLRVRPGSAADRHAAHNGTSVYTGVETFPMLPPRLSEGITSLLPDQDRVALVIRYTVQNDGSIRPDGIERALVRNRAHLVYEEVGEWLEGTGPLPENIDAIPGLREQVLLQNEAAQRMRRRRFEGGALDLETIEAGAVMEGAMVRDLIVRRQNAAHCLIEEFMIGANTTIVGTLAAAGMPMIQRVVREPRDWKGIQRTAAEHGEYLPPEPDPVALSRFLTGQRTADPEGFPDLSLTIVKLIGPGIYLPLQPGEASIGHFGLAISNYTHGTAPNRRYVDIIIQRLLKAALRGEGSPYTSEDLADLAEWLTGREKASQKVERFMRKAAGAVLLGERIGESFDAIVTGASERGTYVRLIAPPVEGRVMEGEYGLYVGQRVRVRLILTDPYNGYIDFVCTGRSEP
ncbi:RNB domain-containing ribonuclease [Methanofollis fontis]|uniref:Ribonuclease II n=1 Tax=Methanofollis fontis TaxID=2052832 RepID=A0A483CTI4_9EURY|nr:RNB domain-containing ribonuclease [Methanofollis fontis]TAJ45684.1 ribonuclease II [Methanofollis fontis]